MDLLLIVELFAVLTGLAFIILLVCEDIWCWPIGIISSMASIYLFFCTKLYMESILYFYYVLIGLYGWYVWKNKGDKKLAVKKVSVIYHLGALSLGVTLSLFLGWFFTNYSDAERSYADSTSTIFSFITSFMEAHKILSSWIYWMIINAFSVWLYLDRGLQFYSCLMVVYFLLSVVGFIIWQKSYKDDNVELEKA